MYKISKSLESIAHQEFPSPESAEYPKIHFTSSSIIAEEVYCDLERRFGPPMTVDALLRESECTWDPGGMMFANDEEFRFDLSSITVCCLAQHFSDFEAQVNRRVKQPIRGNDVKYIKLHGAYSCICLTPEEFSKLHDLIAADKGANSYHERAIKAEDEFMNRAKQVQADLNQHYEFEHLAKSVDTKDKGNLN